MSAAKGRLYLVPAPLDFGCDSQAALSDTLPAATLQVAAGLGHWICENAKSIRAYLKRVGEVVPLAQPLQALSLQELPRDVHKKGDLAAPFDARPMLIPAMEGRNMGLVSEAGMPAVADPGSSVVRAAHDLGIEVVPLVGPVSLLLALAASGLNGQNFAFVGYLPQDPAERSRRVRELESLALNGGLSVGVAEADWQLIVRTTCRHLVGGRCAAYGQPERPLECKYLDAWGCAPRVRLGRPRPPGYLRLSLEHFDALTALAAFDADGRITRLPAATAVREHIETCWREAADPSVPAPSRRRDATRRPKCR